MIVVLGWCLFWWGVYVGEVRVAEFWLSSAKSDLSAVALYLQGPVEDAMAQKVLTALRDLKQTEVHDVLEEAGRFSTVNFVLYPLIGPYRRLEFYVRMHA